MTKPNFTELRIVKILPRLLQFDLSSVQTPSQSFLSSTQCLDDFDSMLQQSSIYRKYVVFMFMSGIAFEPSWGVYFASSHQDILRHLINTVKQSAGTQRHHGMIVNRLEWFGSRSQLDSNSSHLASAFHQCALF